MCTRLMVALGMACSQTHVLLRCSFYVLLLAGIAVTDVTDIPIFGELINNITVPVGREATLVCVVEDLASYKVAWLRVDTQTILTIASHVITKNHRISVTHSDQRIWHLTIKDVRESDGGWYMCQINTDPMKSQVGFLEVVVPPDILDHPTSTDMVVREGSHVTLRCAATGSPTPSVTWRREGGEGIPLGNGKEVASVEGTVFNITRVNRLHMGAYLCIASNGVPPSVSKRIMLIVHFPPMIWIPHQLVGAYVGERVTLECNSEAYPKSLNYWTNQNGDIVSQGGHMEPVMLDNAYKVNMKLKISPVGPDDFGTFRCVSKNSLGDTDGHIKLYQIPTPTTTYHSHVTTTEPVVQKDLDVLSEDNAASPELDHDANELIPLDAERVTGEHSSAADLKLRGTIKTLGTSSENVIPITCALSWFVSICLLIAVYVQ